MQPGTRRSHADTCRIGDLPGDCPGQVTVQLAVYKTAGLLVFGLHLDPALTLRRSLLPSGPKPSETEPHCPKQPS